MEKAFLVFILPIIVAALGAIVASMIGRKYQLNVKIAASQSWLRANFDKLAVNGKIDSHILLAAREADHSHAPAIDFILEHMSMFGHKTGSSTGKEPVFIPVPMSPVPVVIGGTIATEVAHGEIVKGDLDNHIEVDFVSGELSVTR